jgi:hypothetical protein
VTTSNDYAVTVLHTSQITIGHTRSSQSVTVFTSRFLVAAFNDGRSPSSGFQNCPCPQLPASHSSSSLLNPSGYLSVGGLFITSQYGPRRKHGFSVAVQLLHSCLLAEPLPSNGCCVVVYFAVVA